jgi:hypothetical protein
MIHLRETLATLRRESHTRALLVRSLFWFYPVSWIALWLAARVLRDRGHLSAIGYDILLRANLLMALVLALLASWLLNLTVAKAAEKIATGGSSPRAPSFSLEESMIARGAFQNARETLESRLDQGPDDLAVQLRLAELCTRQLRDPSGAERWYLAARRAGGDERQRITIANGLIDVYRSSGQSGPLMVELARFAKAWPGTRAAEDARRELQGLKRELT